MRIEPTMDRVSIVLLGSFNPKIFHPAWLALNGLISSEQAGDAEISIVHADITQIAVAYMKLDIHPGRFMAACDMIHKEVVRDLVLSVFGEHLSHSPVWQLGINRSISFSCGSEHIRDKLGTRLAPRDPWGPWGKEIDQSPTDGRIHGGMIRLIMRQQPRPDGLQGHIQSDIRPDGGDSSSVVVDINNHFNVSDPQETIGCSDAMEILKDQWQTSLERAESIADGLMATTQGLK